MRKNEKTLLWLRCGEKKIENAGQREGKARRREAQERGREGGSVNSALGEKESTKGLCGSGFKKRSMPSARPEEEGSASVSETKKGRRKSASGRSCEPKRGITAALVN